jgi:hypothetical protein
MPLIERRAGPLGVWPDDSVAVAYGWRGEADSAFGWLEQAHRQRDAALSLLVIEPGLSGVRGDLRFKALLRKMNFPA